MMAGYLLIKFNLVEHLRNIKIIGWSTLIFGIILYLSDKSEVKNQIESNFTIRSALVIGFFQILSLIPGVSRSGITITGGRLLKFKRYDSAKISFLLSIPTLAAVSMFDSTTYLILKALIFLLIVISIVFSFFLLL